MAPKDLYYLPQVLIMTKDGSKDEFAGITQYISNDEVIHEAKAHGQRCHHASTWVIKATWLDQGKAVPK